MEIVRPNAQSDFADALRTLKCGKNLFFLVILLAIVATVASFVVTAFVPGVFQNSTVVNIIVWALPISKFASVVSAFLLMLVLFASLLTALAGRLGGACGFAGAFLWSLLLLAMLMPWQQLLMGTFAVGAMYNFSELSSQLGKAKGNLGGIIYFYGRFMAFPLVALTVLLFVQLRFGAGYSRSKQASTDVLPSERPIRPI